VSADFGDYRQHDACEFLERILESVRCVDLAAGFSGEWSGVQLDAPAATQVDRVFGVVQETRPAAYRASTAPFSQIIHRHRVS
jgi:hypothetical protein